MKPRQHAGIEGCPIQTAAACVTGAALRTGCHVRGGCGSTVRSIVVLRPQSGLLGRRAYYPAAEVARIFIGEDEA